MPVEKNRFFYLKSSDMRCVHCVPKVLDSASQTATGEVHGGNSTVGKGRLNPSGEIWGKPSGHGQHPEQPGHRATKGAYTALGPSCVQAPCKARGAKPWHH